MILHVPPSREWVLFFGFRSDYTLTWATCWHVTHEETGESSWFAVVYAPDGFVLSTLSAPTFADVARALRRLYPHLHYQLTMLPTPWSALENIIQVDLAMGEDSDEQVHD